MSTEDIKSYIAAFVDEMNRKRCLKSEWLRQAIKIIPRHLFIDKYYELKDGKPYEIIVDQTKVSEDFLKRVYSDNGLMIRLPPNHSAASQPSLILTMLEHLSVLPGNKVLEIGTGSGWNSALLAYRVGDRMVYSVDIQKELIETSRGHLQAAGFPKLNLRTADGGYGWAENAPFDRIIVTVGCPDIPKPWRDQLSEEGILLLPLKVGPIGDPLLRLRKKHGKVIGKFVGWSGFRTLQGAFYNDKEDIIEPPWEPLVEKLLSRKPYTVNVSEPIGLNCVFLAYLKGIPLQAMVDPEGKLGYAPMLLDREHQSIWVLNMKAPTVKVFGSTASVDRCHAMLRQWTELGKPKITDYTVEILENKNSSENTSEWLIQRPNVLLWFCLLR